MRRGAHPSVSQCASMAASFTGWCSATCLADRSPDKGWRNAATPPTTIAMPRARTWNWLRSPRRIISAWMPATANPTVAKAAMTMWSAWVGKAGLNMAAHGSMSMSAPAFRVNPVGVFIQALAATTNTAEDTPLRSTPTPAARCSLGGTFFQPYRYTPRKMASRKNAKPSIENGMPTSGPARSMKSGHSSPSSNDSTVPLTAPTANITAVPFDHRFASSSQLSSFVRRYMPSAMTMSSGIAIPTTANTMWKASDIAICERAAKRSVTPSSVPGPMGGPDLLYRMRRPCPPVAIRPAPYCSQRPPPRP